MDQRRAPGGFSSVDLRGYVRGNHLAPNVSTLELEERYRVTERWAIAGFAGSACLYDGTSDCAEGRNWYSTVGGGVIFTVKPQKKMVVRLDYAVDRDDHCTLLPALQSSVLNQLSGFSSPGSKAHRPYLLLPTRRHCHAQRPAVMIAWALVAASRALRMDDPAGSSGAHPAAEKEW